MRLKKPFKIVIVLLCIWISLGIIDLAAVAAGNKPLLSFPFITADNGGSGRYIGPGWAFDIRGNFMPEDKNPGVTEWTYYLFGIKLF